MLNETLMIEVVIRKKLIKKDKSFPEGLSSVIEQYKQYESEDRIVANFPLDWKGMKDGTISNIIKHYYEAVYIALAFYVNDDCHIISDFEGKEIESYSVVIDNEKFKKYVKKKLRIVKILNKETETFEVKGYAIDFDYPDSVIKILDVYSVGKESGLHLDNF
jgi:hypothetical protein